eukprot:6200329-Pleurochrysis_carterae.AAC.2
MPRPARLVPCPPCRARTPPPDVAAFSPGCVQRARSSAPRNGPNVRAYAVVVYFRARAPSAHCAKVMLPASAAASSACTRGRSHSGAWSAMRRDHAGLMAAPQSARFSSTIHGTPAPWAASTRSAENAVRRLCLETYLAHLRGMGSPPSGRLRLCRQGWCATKKELHGGAANTAA